MKEQYEDKGSIDSAQIEWLVEYVVEYEGSVVKHISILCGRGLQEVQHALFAELRNEYPHAERVDVTVLTMEPTKDDADIDLFDEGLAYSP